MDFKIRITLWISLIKKEELLKARNSFKQYNYIDLDQAMNQNIFLIIFLFLKIIQKIQNIL